MAGLVITKQVVIKGIRVEDVAKDEQGRAVWRIDVVKILNRFCGAID